MATVSAPSAREALAFAITLGTAAKIRTVTLAAEADLAGIVADARDARTKWT